jgi:hypothetical protein
MNSYFLKCAFGEVLQLFCPRNHEICGHQYFLMERPRNMVAASISLASEESCTAHANSPYSPVQAHGLAIKN